MKAFQISETKNFMSRFLLSDCFDDFLLAEAAITTYNTFLIDGHIVPDFYKSIDADMEQQAAPYPFSAWSNMRGLCFDLIKGKRTPVNFRFTLYLKPEKMKSVLEKSNAAWFVSNLAAFILNVKYQDGAISLITAVSYHTFVADKNPDLIWDNCFESFLRSRQISYTHTGET